MTTEEQKADAEFYDDILCDTNIRIIKKLASGGMGDVFLGEWQGAVGFRKVVAVKTIRQELLKNKKTKELFIGEAKLVSDLIHENIIQIYQLGKRDAGYYIVMEALFGLDLRGFIKTHVKQNFAFPVELGAFVISRVCRALHYAHHKTNHEGRALGIVHRDVTPNNVMINYGGVVKLMDFGIAKALSFEVIDERRSLMGKFPYMSPEQARREGTDGRSDIYALGLVAYELLTGKMWYRVKDVDSLLAKMNDDPIPPIRKFNPEIPDVLNDIIMKSVQLAPDARFSTAREMGQALEHYMYGKGYGPTNEKLAAYIAEVDPRAKQLGNI
ncbi:MAG: serine/threonine-protein kinase [Verrucomicrobiota bacterium]